MAGDTITDEFKGNVYSDRLTTSNVKKRFRIVSYKLRTAQIRNSGATYDALVGDYASAFATNAYTIKPGYALWLEYVDLYNLGYFYSTNYTTIEIIGTY